MRRALATASMAATLGFGENALVIVRYVVRVLRVLLFVAIWRSLFAGRSEVNGLELAQVLTYTVLGSAFGDQLEARTRLSGSIWDGVVTTRLLRPMPVFADYIAEAAGSWVFVLLTYSAPLLLLAPLLGVDIAPAGPDAAGLFVFSLVLAIAVGLAIDVLWGIAVVWADQSLWSIEMARAGATQVLSGALIPLPLLPFGLGTALSLLPFASMASAPLLVYVGHAGAARLVLLQLGWAVVLWAAAAQLWRSSLPRMVSHGG
jgi:ABC-2 type transport system permease protein